MSGKNGVKTGQINQQRFGGTKIQISGAQIRSAVMMLLIADILCLLVFGGCGNKKQQKQENKAQTQAEATPEPKGITVCIDPGHGGVDPGKVGVNDALEKDINLSVSLLLRQNLMNEGYEVIMTRDSDNGLYEEGEKHKKMADLKRRIAMIEEKKPDIVVGIHQNSFTSESSRGAQVFYYKDSAEGAKLAGILQNRLITELADGNTREAKSNDNYYMLVHTSIPMVIIECGFLSNPGEADLLTQVEYQQTLADIIKNGINEYFSAG